MNDDEHKAMNAMLWTVIFTIAVLLIVAVIFEAQEAKAEGIAALKQDIVEQAAAAAKAEGDAKGVQCFQTRTHGAAAVCITLEEWKRQHEDDRSALPEYRVGMRL